MIVRVWGSADEHALEFKQSKSGGWEVVVPPDLRDGQYAALIRAENIAGQRAMWTGILYMSGGVARLTLKESRFTAWLSPERIRVRKLPRRFTLTLREG